MMETEVDLVSKLPTNSLINPTGFDVTMSALLIGLGAEKYIDNFRKHNIGQCTLMELSDEDLVKLGVDDSDIRAKLIEAVKNLPIYEETDHINLNTSLDILEITNILEESSQHLYRIYLSMMTNTLTLKKKKTEDCLFHKDKYGSSIALSTLSEMTNILNSMDIALHTQLKEVSRNSKHRKTKKIVVGTLGSILIGLLSLFFIKSIKQLV